jgi:hypothetical protein
VQSRPAQKIPVEPRTNRYKTAQPRISSGVQPVIPEGEINKAKKKKGTEKAGVNQRAELNTTQNIPPRIDPDKNNLL